MRKKIVIVDNENLTIRRKELFCIDELRAAGFEVEFWDVAQLVVEMDICDQLSTDYLRKFENLEQFKAAIEEQDTDNTIFVVEVWYNWSSRKILKALKKAGCYTVRVNMYSTITSHNQKPRLKFSLSTITYLLSKVGRELSYVAFKAYCALNSMNRKFDYCISSDSRRKSTQTLINHPDWVRSQIIDKAPKSEQIPTEPYVVFIDQFYPYHPDFKRDYVGVLGDGKAYQRELNRFFDVIKRDLGYNVVIAAHPKATYDEDTFNGRKIVKYKTEELVRHCEATLLHTSLAASYILIFDKPLMLITNAEHKKTSHLMLMQQRYEEFMHLKTFETEAIEKIDLGMFSKVDKDVREEYIYSILTSKGIEHLTNAEILINTFSKL